MSENYSETPIRPSTAASVTHALCMAVNDLVHESGSDMDRRTYLKVCALASAAELLSQESARFHFNLLGRDHDLLEEIEERWCERQVGNSTGFPEYGQ